MSVNQIKCRGNQYVVKGSRDLQQFVKNLNKDSCQFAQYVAAIINGVLIPYNRRKLVLITFEIHENI